MDCGKKTKNVCYGRPGPGGRPEKLHNEHACHYEGERRQNLLNTIKMYLSDMDDRPSMTKAAFGSETDGKTKKFGPIIGYPGYADYNHPYFSDPYNKMPWVAMTAGQARENPCPPINVSSRKKTVGLQASHELRGGNLYVSCGCTNRDGLQDRCPRTECGGGSGGKPECLATMPGPCCGPSQYPKPTAKYPNPKPQYTSTASEAQPLLAVFVIPEPPMDINEGRQLLPERKCCC